MKSSIKHIGFTASGAFLLFGLLWILGTEYLLHLLIPGITIEIFSDLQILKGILFVLIAAIFLFMIVSFMVKHLKKTNQQLVAEIYDRKSNEKQFEAFLKNTNEGIYALELKKPMDIRLPVAKQLDYLFENSVLKQCNHSFLKMNARDLNHHAIQGVGLHKLTGWEKSRENIQIAREFVNNNYSLTNRESVISYDDKTRYILNNVTGFVEKNRLLQIWGSQIDITQKKEIENEQFELIQRLAEQNQNLQQFSYIVSHNLRAPVANIMGIVNVLKDADDKTAFIDEIEEGLFKTSHDLDQTLHELNKILHIKQDTSHYYNETNINQVFVKVWNVFKSQRLLLSPRIKTDFSNWEKIKTIPAYLENILYNLLSNSLKFHHPDRKLRITIHTGFRDKKKTILIKDNGLGFDMEKYRKDLFVLHKRFHPSHQGRGLGLYMVKLQMEAMGGKVEIASEKGKGTTAQLIFQNIE